MLGDIGTHAHQLLTYVTGTRVASVLADVGAALPGRTVHDTASVIVRMEGGARGVLFTTKAATGAENAMSPRSVRRGRRARLAAIGGERTARHAAQPSSRAADARAADAAPAWPGAAARLPPGHPEGFLEAFANVYADFADLVLARRTGAPADPLAREGPDAATGLAGLDFIDACLQSARDGSWVDCPDG